MNKKTEWLLYFSIIVILTLVVEVSYIQVTKGLTYKEIRDKREFVLISGIPDCAISTEANYIRHRSLTNIFSIYRDDPDLTEYFPSTFIYSYSHILNKEKTIEK